MDFENIKNNKKFQERHKSEKKEMPTTRHILLVNNSGHR